MLFSRRRKKNHINPITIIINGTIRSKVACGYPEFDCIRRLYCLWMLLLLSLSSGANFFILPTINTLKWKSNKTLIAYRKLSVIVHLVTSCSQHEPNDSMTLEFHNNFVKIVMNTVVVDLRRSKNSTVFSNIGWRDLGSLSTTKTHIDPYWQFCCWATE